MKKFIPASALLLIGLMPANASVEHLLPPVKVYEANSAASFNLKRNVSLTDATGCELLRDVLVAAGANLTDNADASITVEPVSEIPGAFNHNLPDFPDEAYAISVSDNNISIKVLTPTGVIRAAQTLAQLAIGSESIAGADIKDWPAFKLRGYMHDVGRSFISADELKKHIRLLSAFKVNTFHWHLTENQAWRFEVKAYPQLTSAESMTRYAGQYYTQEQIREVLAEARKHGVTVIPEIDMPGHAAAFERAMGFEMQTAQGKEVLKKVLTEVAEVFADSPYIHMGGDEKTITDNTFLDTMIDHLHSLGKKVVCWNRINGVNIADHKFDMTQMWATSGSKIAGIPNIDCRYNYTNHFDVFADLVGIYKSSIYYTPIGTDEVAGTISAPWNDRKTPTQTDIIRQNNFYANVLASAERAWKGGGERYIETGGTMLPNSGSEYDEFADWERRFLFHKNTTLNGEPIPYVKQTNVRWHVTEGFPNNGNSAATFAPENGLDNPSWTVTPVTGAGIYLRHTWGGTVPGLYPNAALNQTAYAYTYVYSPVEQTAGALIEFQNYGRSENDLAPDNGKWDRKGSRIWLNDEELIAPNWTNAGKSINSEVDLGNENFTAREPLKVKLREGWNKVLVKLPYVAASGVRLNKWLWTFVLTDSEGKDALEGLIYSPSKCLDEESETLAMLIAEARSAVAEVIKDEVGYYASSAIDTELLALAGELEATLADAVAKDERQAQCARLQSLLDAFRGGYVSAGIVQPAKDVYYQLCTPQRSSRYASASGSLLQGEAAPTDYSAWTFKTRTDGTFNIVNYSNDLYIAPTAANNTQLTLAAAEPAAGWQVKPADEIGYVIITSGSVQLNQTNASLGFKVYNWGSGTNISDTGCKYQFIRTSLKKTPDSIEEAALSGLTHADALYDLSGRKVISSPRRGIYISQGRKVIR
ncbi:MAG: beta-N-acetylhexosaminidase [Muribaculaceae bacterium]|nr:beta-N-acetylhexosaminidase [Muribaculaceae bacterium]